MTESYKVFLDTSVLLAGTWSASGGARQILLLGEAEVISILVSSEVLAEAEEVLRRKAPDNLGFFTLLLQSSGITIAPAPPPSVVQRGQTLTGHKSDGLILAAALAAKVDYFVTLDRRHLLQPMVQQDVPFLVGTPGDFLGWYRAQISMKPNL